MAKYRLVPKAGPHKQGNKTYFAGDVVENVADLVALFPGKFELIEGTPGEVDPSQDPEHVEADNRDVPQTRRRGATIIHPQETQVSEEDESNAGESDEDEDKLEGSDEDKPSRKAAAQPKRRR